MEFHSSLLATRVFLKLAMVDALASLRSGARGGPGRLGLLDRLERHIASEPSGVGHLLLTVHAMDRARLEERLARVAPDLLSVLAPPIELSLDYFIDLAEAEGLCFLTLQGRLLAHPEGPLFRAFEMRDGFDALLGLPGSGPWKGRLARRIHRALFFAGEREAFRGALSRWGDAVRRGEDPDVLADPLARASARGWETFRVFSVLQTVHRREEQRLLALNVRRAGRAAALFRRETGSFPASIHDLVPEYLEEIPLDPADGKPLDILLEPGGAMVRGRSSDDRSSFALGAAFERVRDAEALRMGDLAYEDEPEDE
jgi:hypothetical protein